MTKFIILGVISLIPVAIFVEIWWKRGKSKGPLAKQLQPDLPKVSELGMEETDMEIVRAATEKNNRIETRNRSLSRH
ncbi:MAG: hypothetical protein V3V13_06245 [Paracoccaceae bacterium]